MNKQKNQTGFTIVELLIVILVIGILVAVTIVAYNGISKRATISGVQSDLAGSAKKLETLKVTSANNQYPDSFGDTGINFSADTLSSYYKDSGNAFCVSLTRGGVSYYITNGASSQPGLCSSANLGGQTVFVYNTNLSSCATTVQLPITLPTSAAGSTIDWGDGTTEALSSALQSHTYATEGTYTVRYDGPISAVNSATIPVANQGCLSEVSQWKDGAAPTQVGFGSSLNLSKVAEPPHTVTNMSSMFSNDSNFNQPIGGWDVSRVTLMTNMFWEASSFNQPIGNWNTSKVTSFSYMFYNASAFNQPIGNWDTSSLTGLSYMFYGASAFNQPIGNWNTSKVGNMQLMFSYASSFNQPIGNWDTSKATTFNQMFYNASVFNQPIGNWNTSKVTNMNYMFGASAFNQNISTWDTSKVVSMNYMFNNATSFNQDLSGWNVSTVAVKPPLSFSTGATAWTLPKPSNW